MCSQTKAQQATPSEPLLPCAFEHTVLQLLQNQSSVTEHQLMLHLVAQGFESFQPNLEPLKMFQTHFLLFHFLYRLQIKWAQEQQGFLHIHTLDIHLLAPMQSGETLPGPNSDCALRNYYLDFKGFYLTQEDDVLDLLARFWQGFNQATNRPVIKEHDIEHAKKVLAWPKQKPLNKASIQQQYRTLSQQHHPDKGGQAEDFHAINHAKEVLLRALM